MPVYKIAPTFPAVITALAFLGQPEMAEEEEVDANRLVKHFL